MKLIEMAFMILVFNIIMSVVSNSGLFSVGVPYDEAFISKYQQGIQGNISTTSETQQFVMTMRIVGVIFSTITFNWLYAYIPGNMQTAFSPFITGLNVIGLFILAVAIIELFMKRPEVLR